ncbi:MAG: right-handed parallel beta-helix repeat-containing protein, partial [Thermoplasmatales archaeon]
NLIGEGKDNTIIDGGKKDNVVIIAVDNVSIKNFYINNSRSFGSQAGIKIYGERKNITIDNNIIIDNLIGISVGQAEYYKRIYFVNITNNLICYNKYGILLFEGENSRILNNSFINCGIFISTGAPRDNKIEDNTINGLPLVYLEDDSNKTIQPNAGQVILVNCYNIIVSSQNLNIKCYVGIELILCTNCNVIKNNISGKFYGIFSLYSFNNNIQANQIENVTWGLRLQGSNDNIISFNRIEGRFDLVEIVDSYKNKISDNLLTNGKIAIDMFYSSENIIINNEFNNLSDSGLNLLFECNRNQILNNTITNCSREGIYISGTKRISWDSACLKNIISSNEIKNNRIGIVLDESAITKVYYNNIVQNNIGVEVRSAKYNKIYNNNIYDNNEEDAILKNSFSSRFDSNFWNETKRIHIIKGGIYRWDFWGDEYYEIISLPRFDWNAVNESYDIGG